MKCKKSLKIMLTLVMVVMLMFTTAVTVFAAADVEASLSGGSVKAGENVNVALSIKGNAITSFTATVTYDTNALTLVSGTPAAMLDGALSAHVIPGEGAVVYLQVPGKNLDGVAFNLNFAAAGDASGDYEVSLINVSATTTSFAPLSTEVTQTATVSVIQPVSGVTLSKTSTTLNVGETEQLTETVAPTNASNKNVTWTSSAPSVATVVDGLITAVGPGNATITVETEDGGFKATCAVEVLQPVTGVSLNKSTTTLRVSETEQLTATVAPTNASNKNITWTSSDPSVATVNNGLITAVAAGNATITVKTEDGGFEAACAVEVLQPVTGVELNKNELTLDIGGSEKLIATVNPENAADKNVTWTSSNPAVATVAADGTVTALKAGKTDITVKTNDGNFTDTCDVTVNVREISKTVYTGETFIIPITLDDCVDLAGVTGKLVWNSELLTLNTISPAGNFTFVDNYDNSGKFAILDLSLTPHNGSVTIVYASFTAKADLTEEVTTYVTMDEATLKCHDISSARIYPNVTNVAVTIQPLPPLPGDVDLNGVVDIPDAILLLQYLSQNTDLTPRQKLAADVNKDGQINTADVIIIMQMVLNA